jgi:hypothetical protein
MLDHDAKSHMNLALYIVVPFAISLLCIYFIGRYCADAQKLPYTFKSSDKRAAFERWHDHQVEQLRAVKGVRHI